MPGKNAGADSPYGVHALVRHTCCAYSALLHPVCNVFFFDNRLTMFRVALRSCSHVPTGQQKRRSSVSMPCSIAVSYVPPSIVDSDEHHCNTRCCDGVERLFTLLVPYLQILKLPTLAQLDEQTHNPLEMLEQGDTSLKRTALGPADPNAGNRSVLSSQSVQ